MSTRMMIAVALSLFTAPVMGGEVQHRGFDSGDAGRLAQPRAVSEYRVIRAVPLTGNAAKPTAAPAPVVKPVAAQPVARMEPAPAMSSTNSGGTSDLVSSVRAVAAPTRAAVAPAQATTTMRIPIAAVRKVTPLVAASAPTSQPLIDDRIYADNNARIAPTYTSYSPATVSYEQAQDAYAADSGVEYTSAYTAPATVAAAVSYSSYPGRAVYAPAYAAAYVAPTYYRPYYGGYCAPRYYGGYYGGGYGGYYGGYVGYYSARYCGPSYYGGYYGRSYCGPSYYGGGYYGGGYYNRGYCSSPSFGFSYGYSKGCGSSWGFSIGW